MNVLIQNEYFSIEKCRKNPKNLYVYGDNIIRIGKGGQAIIRDEPNAFGIATKASPSIYMSDIDYFENIRIINNDIFKIREAYKNDMYDSIIFSINGLGTGLSNMQQVCPRTFLYLCERLLDEFNFNNLQSLKSK